jgi:hypothetical protein
MTSNIAELYQVNANFAAKANIRSEEQYLSMVEYATRDYEGYWAELVNTSTGKSRLLKS